MKKTFFNKKGITLLTEENLRLFVALICLSVLVILVAMFFNTNIQNSKLKQANSSIEILLKSAQEIEAGNKIPQFIPNPANWNIILYTDVLRPNSCAGNEYCLCICPKTAFPLQKETDQIKKCDEKGICSDFPFSSRRTIIPILISNTGVGICVTKQEDNSVLIEKKSKENCV